MNRFSAHLTHENRPLYDGPPPQGLSKAWRAGSFFCLVTNPPRGRPVGGGGHSSYQMNRGVTIPALYLNTTIFKGIPFIRQ